MIHVATNLYMSKIMAMTICDMFLQPYWHDENCTKICYVCKW